MSGSILGQNEVNVKCVELYGPREYQEYIKNILIIKILVAYLKNAQIFFSTMFFSILGRF